MTLLHLCLQSIGQLKPQVDELMRSSNNIYKYVSSVSNSLRERQRVIDGPKELHFDFSAEINLNGTITCLCPPSANNAVVIEYTDSVEEQHAYIKETVDTVFPSNIRILQVQIWENSGVMPPSMPTNHRPGHSQGVLDRVRQKIQKLEKAIQAQREDCKEPCKTKCPIPVVSGEGNAASSC